MSLIEKTVHSWTPDSVRLIETPTLTTKATMFYVQEIGSFKTTYPYYVRRENLSSYLIVLTLSGSGTLDYRNRQHALTPGDLFYINCHEPHTYKTPKNDHWDFLWCHFQGVGAQGYHDYFGERQSPVIHLETPTRVASDIQEMIENVTIKPPKYQLMNAKIITGILTDLILETDQQTRQIEIPSYITVMLNDINRHFQEPLMLKTYSLDLGVSAYYLSKMFRKHTGVTFQEFLITSRMTEAKTMLRYSDDSVMEIAKRVGINNPSHFINLFKVREGVTPHKYRTQWRK
ncbi:MAG: AraC family transcriptional regulator [Acholeplasmataceae bacterium]|nr:AraC family transcriptional regulator [Acholeplasmataceae bacterium]